MDSNGKLSGQARARNQLYACAGYELASKNSSHEEVICSH
ncbi:hypothetical protein NC99_04740 [Sunxiuqinia dokdonensis]|uniref:Uncharacterized protein n=1 Tax=Sunxiuqinia dokdonensis TaxID=1409788 RepID=A0A0L8VEI8_9BACT|nr:hypothetical protein NC99_04740 [Sunxiuqinia dokdonensis]